MCGVPPVLQRTWVGVLPHAVKLIGDASLARMLMLTTVDGVGPFTMQLAGQVDSFLLHTRSTTATAGHLHGATVVVEPSRAAVALRSTGCRCALLRHPRRKPRLGRDVGIRSRWPSRCSFRIQLHKFVTGCGMQYTQKETDASVEERKKKKTKKTNTPLPIPPKKNVLGELK